MAITGQITLPSIFDCHVHFRIPGEDYKEDWVTGTQAALAGGVTGVVDMPTNLPPIVDAETLQLKKSLITLSGTSLQYKLPLGVSDANLDTVIANQRLASAIKVFLTPHATGLGLLNEANIEKLFSEAQVLLMIHAELGGHSREQAVAAVQLILNLVRKYNKPVYFCHISTKEELDLIATAKQEGLPVSAEVTLHHLWLDESNTKALGQRSRVNPPLRTEADRLALWQGIREGIIDTIATDHAPHTVAEKDSEAGAAGFPSIEFFLPLLLTGVAQGLCSMEDIVRCCSTNPAMLFGFKVKPRSVTIDATVKWTIQESDIKSKAGWSPYIGMAVQGKVITINQP